MASLELFRRYARIGSDDEAQLFFDAAKEWLEKAGVQEREGSALYDLAVYQLGTHYYDNRGVISENGSDQVPMGVFSIMHQLRSEPSPKEAGP